MTRTALTRKDHPVTTATHHDISTGGGCTHTTVGAVEHPCGLLTYRVPDDWEPGTYYPWRVGHHSGVCIAAAHTEQGAIEAVAILANLTDWTASTDAIKAALPGGPNLHTWDQLEALDTIHPNDR